MQLGRRIRDRAIYDLRHLTGVVGQRFRPATACAAPALIADVSAHTPAHSLRFGEPFV